MKKKRKSVQLFNFSFVDILATTIGVLLFIMLMAVINLSGMVAHTEVQGAINQINLSKKEIVQEIGNQQKEYAKIKNENSQLRKAVKGDTSGLANEISKLEQTNKQIDQQNKQLVKHIKKLKKIRKKFQKKIQQNEQFKLAEEKSYKLPKAVSGSDSVPIHVECRKDGLVILGENVTGDKQERQFCSTMDISNKKSAYGNLIEKVKNSTSEATPKVIVLWIKPDAIAVSQKAINIARINGAPIGWEPSLEEWSF